MHTVC